MFQLNLVSEDLVALLVRERQLSTEQEELQRKLNQSMSQADVAALSLAVSSLFLLQSVDKIRYARIGVFLFLADGYENNFIFLNFYICCLYTDFLFF